MNLIAKMTIMTMGNYQLTSYSYERKVLIGHRNVILMKVEAWLDGPLIFYALVHIKHTVIFCLFKEFTGT